MKLISLTFLFFLLNHAYALPPDGSAADHGTLVLGIGEQRLLKIPGLTRFSVGGNGIVKAQPLPRLPGLAPDPDTILIKAMNAGAGDLMAWTRGGEVQRRSIRVERVLPSQLADASLSRELGNLDEVEIFYSGSGATLRGTIRSLREAARIAALCERHPDTIENLAEPSIPLLIEGEARLRAWAPNAGARLTIERDAGALWVRGNVDRADRERALRAKIKALFPLARVQLQSLPDDSPTVHFKVYLVELKRNRFRSFGLRWPPGQEGAFRVTSSGVQNMLQLDVALDMLETEGSAKVLSRPELVVRAPGEAELFSGGEIPITNRSHYSANTMWKNFGLTLQLKVTHSTAERVRLDIQTEVSHLDITLANDIDKTPGLQTNRMKTQVDARYGEPLFLSGLLEETLRKNARGIPLLRDIPVLGALFGSEDWLSERSELVAILLPNLTPPPAPMERTELFSKAPRGPVPPPRNWMNPADERALRQSPEYPWNALKNESARQ